MNDSGQPIPQYQCTAKPRNSSAVEKLPHAAVSSARCASAQAMQPPMMASPRNFAHGDFARATRHCDQSTPGFAATMRGSFASHGWL